MRCAIFAILCLLASSARGEFAPSLEGKKLIAYGWDAESTAYVRDHIREMEQRPFDGIVIRATYPPQPGAKRAGSIGRHVFSKTRFTPAEYQHNIDALAVTKFEKFTDNFIQVTTGDVDFFDEDGWEATLHNIAIIAKIAKAGHCVGIMFDPEQYSENRLWTCHEKSDALRSAHSRDQYLSKAKDRGRQFMRSINAEFPNTQILCLFGPSLSWDQARASKDKPGYDLLAPFIEGMCLAADEGTRITDGFEQSYMYRVPIAFAKGRETIIGARNLFEDKSAFDRVMRVGFGLWLDNDSRNRPWKPDVPQANLFTPTTWQSAVHHALAHSDKYVWAYCERLNWWTGENLGQAYVDAQFAARSAPGEIKVGQKPIPPERNIWIVDAESRQDPKLFADLLKTHEVFIELPNTDWQFRPDPENAGDKERLFAPEIAAAGWSPIEISRFWEQQGWDYDGYAWYRKTFTAPQIPKGKSILLAIGAADESADVWLNGEKVGAHDIGEHGWDRAFSLDITKHLRQGNNTLAIRVLDRAAPGGLWRPIKILISK